jgi:ATP-dependent exoDNAse (exonuclease V) beta subunit
MPVFVFVAMSGAPKRTLSPERRRSPRNWRALRIATVADESELDEVHDTKRNLFYVACTRARNRFLVSGIRPASEVFSDLTARRA